jgi:hypothetical protein
MPLSILEFHNRGVVRKFVSTETLERFKQMARRTKRARGISHHEALEVVARRVHFDTWHQVTLAHQAMLPTETAVRRGIVIGMNVSEADGLDEEIFIESCAARLVADPLLPALYAEEFYRLEYEGIDEEDGRPLREKWTEQELRESAQDHLNNLVLYRFEGEAVPRDPVTIVKLVAEVSFFGPEIVWIGGRMYDTFEIGGAELGYIRFRE